MGSYSSVHEHESEPPVAEPAAEPVAEPVESSVASAAEPAEAAAEAHFSPPPTADTGVAFSGPKDDSVLGITISGAHTATVFVKGAGRDAQQHTEGAMRAVSEAFGAVDKNGLDVVEDGPTVVRVRGVAYAAQPFVQRVEGGVALGVKLAASGLLVGDVYPIMKGTFGTRTIALSAPEAAAPPAKASEAPPEAASEAASEAAPEAAKAVPPSA